MADATGDDAMADAGDDANEGAGDAAPRGGRRRHELDALDRELRSKWRRSAVVQDETSVYASPLVARTLSREPGSAPSRCLRT